MKRQIEIDREAAQTLRRWLRQGYIVPEELPPLYMALEDEAAGLMEDGATGEAAHGQAPRAGAFVAEPSDVKALISWLENRRGVNVNITMQTFDNVTCSYIEAANVSNTFLSTPATADGEQRRPVLKKR